MAEQILMPKLAMAMKQGKVVEWKAREGEWVEKGQLVMVVETEKVTYEIESPAAGFLHIVVEKDKDVPIYETVAWLAATKDELTGLEAETPAPTATAVAGTTPEAPAPSPAATPAREKIRISPAAKKMAQDKGLDYTKITGRGPGGRIERADVIQAFEAGPAVVEAQPISAAEAPGEVIDGKLVKATLPLTGMRRAIAEHMLRSLAVSAQLTSMSEVDMTEMIRFRKQLLAREAQLGIRVTITDLIVMAIANAVRYVPIMNSSLIGEEIKVWEDVNVCVAVAFDRGEYDTGLMVPVVRQADRKSLLEISRAVRDLTTRTRNGKLTGDDLYGGTITLTNFGAFSDRWAISTPILNQPQSTIVGTGAICDQVVARDGEMVIRPMMTLSITCDHRLVDGLPLGRFAAKLAELLENPTMIMV